MMYHIALILPVLVAIVNVSARAPGGMLAGGLTPANVSDPEIQTIATFAAGELGSEYGMTELTEASSQVRVNTYHVHINIITYTNVKNLEPVSELYHEQHFISLDAMYHKCTITRSHPLDWYVINKCK